MNTQSISQKLSSAVNEVVQKACIVSKRSDNGHKPQFLHIGYQAALAAITSVTPFCGKLPDKEPDDKAVAMKVAIGTISHETILFGALAVAHMHVDMSGPVEAGDRGDIMGECIGTIMESRFGPHVLALALRDWIKLTGKDPNDYFDRGMLEAIREEEANQLEMENGAADMVNKFFAGASSKTLN